MDLFDKIGNIAKNIGDRTNDAIEITKLNAKIATEKSAVAEDLKKSESFTIKNSLMRNPLIRKSRNSVTTQPAIMRLSIRRRRK